jgi:hypothetical protein
MKETLLIAIGGILLGASVGLATPPGQGQHFDCSDGGDTSCAADDAGCVSNNVSNLKCSRAIGKAFAKAVRGVIKCHMKQAEMRFKGASITGAGQSEENCEENPGKSAKGKLDATLAKLSFCDPVLLANAATEEAVLFGADPDLSLDGQNGDIFCDSTSGALIGDDDTGSVAATADILKCELTVAKNVSRLVAFAAKCHDKMDLSFFKGADFNEEICEETDPVSHRGGLDKYNQQRDKLITLGICPQCLNGAAMDALAANVLAQVDAANGLIYACNLTP